MCATIQLELVEIQALSSSLFDVFWLFTFFIYKSTIYYKQYPFYFMFEDYKEIVNLNKKGELNFNIN